MLDLHDGGPAWGPGRSEGRLGRAPYSGRLPMEKGRRAAPPDDGIPRIVVQHPRRSLSARSFDDSENLNSVAGIDRRSAPRLYGMRQLCIELRIVAPACRLIPKGSRDA